MDPKLCHHIRLKHYMTSMNFKDALAFVEYVFFINLFTELPFTYTFPTALFSSVVVTSYVVAILGSYIPATSLREKQIALVLRGVE